MNASMVLRRRHSEGHRPDEVIPVRGFGDDLFILPPEPMETAFPRNRAALAELSRMSTIGSVRSLSIERRFARLLVTMVAIVLLAEFGSPCAPDAPTGLAVRLTVGLTEQSPRDLTVWEELPLEVAFENVGEVEGIPVAKELLSGPYGGATLVARVRNLTEPTSSEEVFLLDADSRSNCNSTTLLLKRGEHARHEGSVCVRLDQVSTGPGTVRDVLVSAFPAAGRYSVRVVYTWAGKRAESAPIEIDVLPVQPDAAEALAALRDMGRAGLWIYRPSLMYSHPERLASIVRLAIAFEGNAYSDLASYTLALHHAGRALLPGVDADTCNARLREALGYLERISSPRFARREASEQMRGRIHEMLGR